MSSLLNLHIINILSEDKNSETFLFIHILIQFSSIDANIFSDFSTLMSDCGPVVGADIPYSVSQLAQSIENPKLFEVLSDEEALQYLQNKKNKSSEQFSRFLLKHGHRGYKEPDPLYKVWREDPIPIIRALKVCFDQKINHLINLFSQKIISGNAFCHKKSQKSSISEIMSSVKTKIDWKKRFLLKYLSLPFARRAVVNREKTKSLLIFAYDVIRMCFWRLAHRMHSEGLIPEADLLFHMTPDEIKDTIQNRNPSIVQKAKQRQRQHKRIDEWRFDPISTGYDFKPIEVMERNRHLESADNLSIRGIPVSVGSVVSKVCVCHKLEDAVNIEVLFLEYITFD